jgi:hypothetical protein
MNDNELEKQVFRTGTIEPATPLRKVRAGQVSAIIDVGALRAISFGDLELIRQIDFPVRDENWASLPPKVVFEDLTETATGFSYAFHFEVADGALLCRVVYEATSDGVLTATGEAEARRDFVTNRTGFTVLHPIDGFAGEPVRLRTVSGGAERLVMPEQISPAQPMKDIAGLAFDVGGARLDIAFEGETFEMEDQRNWSDASYKTYCRPLVEPFAYEIKAGSTLRQVITVTMSGEAETGSTVASEVVAVGPALNEDLPELLLAGDEGWLPDADEFSLLAESGLKALLLRVTPANAATLLAKAKPLLDALSGVLDLEVVLEDDRPAEPQLQAIASLCASHGLSPRHVMALPSDYLTSYQPTSVWPKGLSPEDAFAAARSAFPAARIGGGMLTNFTEFNRCRPETVTSDYITHCNTASVHAADDASVMQTLEALPHIFRSARAIGGDRAYRLGLTAIGMRTNPYGASISENPAQGRLTMTTWDPRARGLFGAAFAVGVLAATEGQGVEALALASPSGPFGVLSSQAKVKRPWYDNHAEAVLHPVFHVLRVWAKATNRRALRGLPKSFAGVAVSADDGAMIVIANLTEEAKTLTLSSGGEAALLDAEGFPDAVRDAGWLDRAMTPLSETAVTLGGYACLFLKPEQSRAQA